LEKFVVDKILYAHEVQVKMSTVFVFAGNEYYYPDMIIYVGTPTFHRFQSRALATISMTHTHNLFHPGAKSVWDKPQARAARGSLWTSIELVPMHAMQARHLRACTDKKCCDLQEHGGELRARPRRRRRAREGEAGGELFLKTEVDAGLGAPQQEQHGAVLHRRQRARQLPNVVVDKP
jgi:hypothetical protein